MSKALCVGGVAKRHDWSNLVQLDVGILSDDLLENKCRMIFLCSHRQLATLKGVVDKCSVAYTLRVHGDQCILETLGLPSARPRMIGRGQDLGISQNDAT